jgi:membrane protease YdiL (CAAX protease family)
MKTMNINSMTKKSQPSLKTWVKAHPVFAFLLFVLTGSWSVWSLLFLVIEPGGIVQNPPVIAFVLAFIGQLWASLCGLLVTYLAYGKKGMQALGARFRNWRVGRWWLALLIIPAVSAIAPILRRLAGYPVDTQAMFGLLIPGLILGIVSGFAEEVGWRGFLLPHLLKRYSPLVATLLVGLVWGGLWHGYADYFGLGDKGLAFWPLMLLLGPGVLTAWSLIMTRVYQRTNGSLLISILMHTGISSSALIFGQTYTTIQEEITWTAIHIGVAFLAAILVWLIIRPVQMQKSEKITN